MVKSKRAILLLLLHVGIIIVDGFLTTAPPKIFRPIPTTPSRTSYYDDDSILTIKASSSSLSTTATSLFAKPVLVGGSKATASSVLRGKLWVFVSKFIISPAQAVEIGQNLVQYLIKDWGDLLTIGVLIKGSLPFGRWIYGKKNRKMQWSEEQMTSKFDKSKTKYVTKLGFEIGELLGIIYATEVGLLIMKELGFQFVKKYPLNQWIAGIVFSVWGAQNLSAIKTFVLTKGGRKDLAKHNATRLLNRLLDVFIYFGTLVSILDFLSVEIGFALRSFFGLSSVASLVFSLASKELVGEFLASLAIQGTNMYQEGDIILLSDETVGVVQKLGWLNTMVRRGDELVVRIPNSELAGMRLANVSRSRMSQVTQTLAIRYEDLHKLPQLAADIKEEIRQSCPTLIDDGFRPFRVSIHVPI